jgi:hypothetical protein
VTTHDVETSAGTVEVHLAADRRFGVGVRVDKENFCPGQESVTLSFVIEDPDHDVTRGLIEVWGTQDGQARKICYVPLPTEQLAGEHGWTWDGHVLSALSGAQFDEGWRGASSLGHEQLPDDLATVEFSPYRLKVILTGPPGVSVSDAALVRVEVHSLVLQLGLESQVPDGPGNVPGGNREVWAQFPADRNERGGRALPRPEGHQTQRLLLEGNAYKTAPHFDSHGEEIGDDQMLEPDRLHDRYRNAWQHADGAGPRLPLLAFVFMKSSEGGAIDAPLALGRVQVLWDWEVVDNDTTAWFDNFQGSDGVSPDLNRDGADFIEATLDYDVQVTRPSGISCHVDRGGRRGSADEPLFLPLEGFELTRCQNRPWGALTVPVKTGSEASRVGVLFAPSHIAGDCFRVRAYVAWYVDSGGRRVSLDVVRGFESRKRRVPSASTGNFQVWRRVELARYRAKTRALAAPSQRVDIRWVSRHFQMAYVEMVPLVGGEESTSSLRRPRVMEAPDFNRHFAAAAQRVERDLDALPGSHWVGRTGPHYHQALARDDRGELVDQHGDRDTGVSFRSFEDWLAVMGTVQFGEVEGQRWTLDRLLQFFEFTVPSGTTTSARRAMLARYYYNDLLREYANRTLEAIAARYAGEERGIHLFHYEGMHDQLANDTSGWTWWGIAPNIGHRTNQAAFNLYAPPRAWDGRPADSTTGDPGSPAIRNGKNFTVAHEIGHLMHLCHAGNGDPGGAETGRRRADALHDARSAVPWQRDANGDWVPTSTPSSVPCIMSYEHGRYQWFCAMCNLKLRGWKMSALSNDHEQNRRPRASSP